MPDIKGAGEGVADKGKGAFGALGHKVGPLPLWGWAAAGVAVVFVVGRFKGGGGGGAGAGSFVIPNTTGAQPIANPQTNAGGASTIAPAASPAPPWWSSPPNWMNATSGVNLPPPPSTNGSAGAGPATTTPTGTQQGGSWWTRLLNPGGNLPAGAAATTIGGVTYSLSSDALARAGITGASAPPAGASPQASTTSVSGSGGIPSTFTGAIPGINEKSLGPYPYADPTLQ